MKDVVDLANTLLSLTGCSTEEINKLRKKGDEELSKIDLEVTDIQHYIESANLNACEGYKAYIMLKDALIRRRGIKLNNRIVNCIHSNSSIVLGLDKLRNDMTTLTNRNYTYAPRVLKYLEYNKHNSSSNLTITEWR